MKQRNEIVAETASKNLMRWLLDVVFPLTPALSLRERGRQAGVLIFSNDHSGNPAEKFSLSRNIILPLLRGE